MSEQAMGVWESL